MSGPLADLDPEPYLRGIAGDRLFIMNLPEPGTPKCGAKVHPEPAQVICDALSRVGEHIVGMATCHLPPGHARPFLDYDGRMKTTHCGLLVMRYSEDAEPSVQSYTWINPRALGALQ